MSKTIYSLNDVHVQVILPSQLTMAMVDKKKKSIINDNFANAGYFTYLTGGETIPVGNLVINGHIQANAATNPKWINMSGMNLTTLVVYNNNTAEIKQISNIASESNVWCAVSGIPILKNGYAVSKDDVLKEGYFGSELYNTWHTFAGVRDGKVILVGARCTYAQMPYLMEVLGLLNCIKLDGGGSFIMKSGNFNVKTCEDRRINNIICW